MNKINLLVIFAVLPFVMLAQTVENDTAPEPKAWDLGGSTSLTLTQTGQVNWVQGGEPAMSYLGTMGLFAKYNKDKVSWENVAKLAFGQQSQGYNSDLRPSDDRIEIETKYGYKLSDLTFISALGSFKSQFASGYEYPEDLKKIEVSKFMSPAYLTAALGIDYKPNKNTSVFISPVSSKTTVVNDTAIDETKYGLELGSTSRSEIGAFAKINNTMQLVKNVSMVNSIELFSNYLENPQNVDVTWDMKLEMSINKYLKTVFTTTLIYDDDIDIPKDIDDPSAGVTKAIQFKEMLSVGFLVSF